ncbi:DUF2007 domain-containing protein [Bowmanella dokdonensis]|uniref:DUF2007 domain-containing protein n=1 Tax=Bowmanella dokdonensis TaxID=751969 RepID=A0A939DKC9_9ALTE|nr:DUF2007 domain-containing protein [Bowmanella dokdonensis]
MKVFASEDRFLVWQVRQLLEDRNIPCFIKNEFAIGGAGDLSPFDCWPEVWITDDGWLPRAKEIIHRWQKELGVGQDWYCPGCGEENAGSFDLCWHCAQERENN